MALPENVDDQAQAAGNIEDAETSRPTSELADNVVETPQELAAKAQSLLADGRRHFVCKNYEEAVNDLDEACKIFCKRFGEMAYECADAYFYYGKSLVELERLTQSVLGVKNGDEEDDNENEDEDENEDEEEEENGHDKEDNIKKEEGSASEKFGGEMPEQTEAAVVEIMSKARDVVSTGEDHSAAGKKDATEEQAIITVTAEKLKEISVAVVADKKTENANEETGGEMDEAANCSYKVEEKEGESEGTDEDKVSNTAEAWVVLDLARVIYEKHLFETGAEDATAKKHDTLRLSEVRMTLGEVCALDEKYPEAINEFMSARDLLQEVCSENDRRLAEIYFQIGSVSELDGKYDQAAEGIKMAAKILEKKKRSLEAQLSATTTTTTTDETSQEKNAAAAARDSGNNKEEEDDKIDKEKIAAEIAELAEILGDIDQRLADLAESQRQIELNKEEMRQLVATKASESTGPSNVNGNSAGANFAASDVTHLVRKPMKRASVDVSSENSLGGAKRTKIEAASVTATESEGAAALKNGHSSAAVVTENKDLVAEEKKEKSTSAIHQCENFETKVVTDQQKNDDDSAAQKPADVL